MLKECKNCIHYNENKQECWLGFEEDDWDFIFPDCYNCNIDNCMW